MSTAAEKVRAKTERRAARQGPGSESGIGGDALDTAAEQGAAHPSPTASGVASRRSRTTVRVTTDLTHEMHANLQRWAQETARAAREGSGRRGATSDVGKELVRLLMDDPALADRVRRNLSS